MHLVARVVVVGLLGIVACGKDKSGADPAPAGQPAGPGSQAAAPATAPTPTPAAAPAPSAPPADPGFGEVAFKTYEGGGTRIVFTTPTKARVTWRNMVGKAVEGTYAQHGKDLEITWDPAATSIGSKSEKFRQMGPCSMARYERVDREGKVHDDSPKIYQQAKPRCDTVRVTR